MSTFVDPGSGNVFIPTAEATAYMLVGYSRNVKTFRSNEWLSILPVTKSKGFFLQWKSEQPARLRYNDLRDIAWPDGNPAPSGQDNLEQFTLAPFFCNRYAPTYSIGQRTLDQADWPLQDAQTKLVGAQMMTGRTILAYNSLANATTNNIWAGNEAEVDGVNSTLNGNAAILTSGQNWGNGTATVKNIQRSIFYAVNKIIKSTLGVISFKDLILVMSPDTAQGVALSPEVAGVMANSVYAATQLENGGLGNPNQEFGLPPKLGGVRVVVDDTVQITSREGASTLASQYVIPLGEAYLLTRRSDEFIGKNSETSVDRNGAENEKHFPVYSTIALFAYEEMTIEAKSDQWDRMVSARVVSDLDLQLTSTKGAFHFAKVLG